MRRLYSVLSYPTLLVCLAPSLCAQANPSITSLSVSSASIEAGSVVTLSAAITVNGNPASAGTVQFLDGTRSLGAIQVIISGPSAGTAELKTNSFAIGDHILTATYSGAPNSSQKAGASSSSPVSLLVSSGGPYSSTTTLAATQDPSGQYALTAYVTAMGGSLPTGNLSFINQTSGASLGSAPITFAAANFPTTTAYLTGVGPVSIAVGDFNQDGILDFAVANDDGTVSVILGDPTHPGQFLDQVKYSAGATPASIVTADFNGDGLLDLATSNKDGTVSILLGNTSSPGQFLAPASYTTGLGGMLVVADFNLDGLPDIANVGASTVVLLNNPNSPGVFIAQPATYPMGFSAAAVGDFNGDGYPDLAVNNAAVATVFFGDPAHPGQFLPQSPAPACNPSNGCGVSPFSVAVGDFNGDGVPDLAVTTSSGGFGGDMPLQVIVFLGDLANRGNFLPPTSYQVGDFNSITGSGGITGLVVGDFNGDGLLDLAALWWDQSNYSPEAFSGSYASLLLNDPSHPGNLETAVTYHENLYTGATGLATGDFTGDGLPDLVFANSGQIAQVSLNSYSASAYLAGVSVLGSGPQSLVASYSGDSNYLPSTSVVQSIPGSVATATTLTTSAFVVDAGGSLTFTAAVSAGQGTVPSSGTVTFYDGSTTLASVPLNSQAMATYTTNSLTVGPHAISAAYGLNGIWLSSTSATLNITVMQGGATQPSGGLLFVPLTPCRVMDTRGNGFSGSFGPPSLSATERDVPIPQSPCGIPSSAMAYALNVTAVPQGPLGYLSIWPTGLVQPLISTLNSQDGRVIANAAIVPAGANGSVSLYATNVTDVVIDISGYFTQQITPNALAFYPLTPCRLADTRGNGFTGAFGQPSLAAGSERSVPVQQGACQIPASAQAYSLNITAVPSAGSPLYFLSAWPAGQAQPYVSTLNSWNGDVVANAAIVPAGTDGGIDLYASNDTDVVIDINGYFAPPGNPGALSFYPVTPCRMVDTRGNGFTGAFGPPSLVASASRDFPLASSACSIPANAQAYSLNATVVPPGFLGYLALWQTGEPQPYVSTLNSWRGEVVANAAIVPAGTNGAVTVFASDPTDLVIDINGVFAP